MYNKLSELSKPCAEVVSKFGDPEAFGERELKVLANIQKLAYGTKFYSQEYVSALLAELEAKDKRIAELEAKLAAPVRLLGEMLVHDWEHSIERQSAFQHRKTAWDARLEEDKKAILAAGFTFTVERDEQ
ncbi:UNVERIFIED_ORG: hypothetical protein EOZ59_0976 [Serratia quinivorans]